MAWSDCISAKALYPVNNSLQVAPDQFVLQSLWQALLLRIAIEQPIERTLLHLGGVVGAYLLAEQGRSQRRAVRGGVLAPRRRSATGRQRGRCRSYPEPAPAA